MAHNAGFVELDLTSPTDLAFRSIRGYTDRRALLFVISRSKRGISSLDKGNGSVELHDGEQIVFAAYATSACRRAWKLAESAICVASAARSGRW